jgi:Pentapeptide repeats (8 copies)
MANPDHIAQLRKGVDAWNAWREQNPSVVPNLSGATLTAVNLSGASLVGVDLSEADLSGANLFRAHLSGANLFRADLSWANLSGADLSGADLSGQVNLLGADLSGENTNLQSAQLDSAVLCGVDLRNADLRRANLFGADLQGADLRQANLRFTNLLDADLRNADLTGSKVFGISAWNLKLEKTVQRDLVITEFNQPPVTVDKIEVAQFIHLLLHNPKIRDVIDTIARKAVLILGRFTPERKAVLDDLREELRKRDYVPILFDFDKPASQDLTATVSTLAHLARFIIADLTDPSSIPYELATVVPTTPVPVQPILLSGNSEFAMFSNLRQRHHWVLPTHHYDTPEQLIADLDTRVIRPAETKVLELRGQH